jgi:hypothetical protein
MLARRRSHRLAITLVAGFAALPLAAAGQEPKTATEAPVLRGRVTSKDGAPLPGVRVRVAVPATDMRFVDAGTHHMKLETISGADGEYRLAFPDLRARTTVSIDAMVPGFRRLVGTLMAGGDARKIDVEPGKTAEANLELEPARYLSGTVVDERGQPVSGVQVSANFSFDRGSGGIERTTSAADGAFEIFNYPVEPHKFRAMEGKGMIFFSHPDYIGARVDDIDAITAERRGDLRIVLPTGRRVTGTVLDEAGRPVANAQVEVALNTGAGRKGTVTDADGRFALRGLNAGQTILNTRALAIKQKAKLPMALDGDKDGIEVRLQPITLPADLKRYAVLGMQLADATPELKSAYDLFFDRGAVILDPGPEYGRLKVGQLAEGESFWIVGNKRIAGVREFVDQILTEAGGGATEEYTVRVVFSFRRPDMVGSNTQHMRLNQVDIRQLKALSERLSEEAK